MYIDTNYIKRITVYESYFITELFLYFSKETFKESSWNFRVTLRKKEIKTKSLLL